MAAGPGQLDQGFLKQAKTRGGPADQSSILPLSGPLCSYSTLTHTHPVLWSTLQRTHRLPKEMTPVEPSAFAAQLIARLEKLKRERDTMSSLEERLQQIQEVRVHLRRGAVELC